MYYESYYESYESSYVWISRIERLEWLRQRNSLALRERIKLWNNDKRKKYRFTHFNDSLLLRVSMKTQHFSMAIWISFYYGNSKKYMLIQKPFERTFQWKKPELSSSFCLAAVYLQIKWYKFSFAKCRQKISTSILIFF